MRYKDSNQRSAEILRMVLPNISKRGAWYAPTAYAVWYEHLGGLNEQLSAELAKRLDGADFLDPKVIDELYHAHIHSDGVKDASQLQQGLEALARRLAEAAADSSGDTEHYASELETHQAALQSISGSGELMDVLGKLLTATSDARRSVGRLRSELDATQANLGEMRERIGQLETEAVRDPLTGLLNRRGFEQAVALLAVSSEMALCNCAVLLLDLDRFKQINDNYGHPFGDQVLSATAKVLNSVLKGSDIVARFGGEEFVVVLPDTPESGALAVAERFREVFGRTKVRRAGTDQVIEKLSVSIGVAVPLPGESLDDAIERGDRALYRAKNEGRNCVRLAAA